MLIDGDVAQKTLDIVILAALAARLKPHTWMNSPVPVLGLPTVSLDPYSSLLFCSWTDTKGLLRSHGECV